jgi:predicted NBD/HSP70 family sugar kinase
MTPGISIPPKNIALAVDTGGTNTRIGLLELDKGLICHASYPTALFRDKNQMAETLYDGFCGMLDSNDINYHRIAGIGHGSTGVPDFKNVTILDSPNLPKSLLPLDLAPRIAKKFKLKTMGVGNDCSFAALGEDRFGYEPKGVEPLPEGSRRSPGAFRISPYQIFPKKFEKKCFYTVSTGENGGFTDKGVIMGRPELGHGYGGDEDFFGRTAECGPNCKGVGHVEAVHSGSALGKMILREYKFLPSNVRNSQVWTQIDTMVSKGMNEEKLLKAIPKTLYDCARSGDPLALLISDWHNEKTCRVIGNILASGYQPQIIAFGGSVTKSMDFSMVPAFRMFAESVARGSKDYTGFQPEAQLPALAVCRDYGENHILLGAGAFVFNKLYGAEL